MTESNIEEELEELGQLVEWTTALKAHNDKAEKQQMYVVPNRKAKRAAKRRKAQGR